MAQRTCRFVTLGCKVNHYDTQLVREALLANGYREARPDESADLCVVNTCTVTQHADRDGRYTIGKLARDNPGAEIVVMGCYAARDPQALRKLPGVVAVVEHPSRLAEALRPLGVTRMPRGISKFDGYHRAFVKVQDGCLLRCTFCIIPQVRPALRSRPPEEIESEVRRLVAAGFREIVLCGIHLGHYGVDHSQGKARTDWCRLWHLVERLCAIPGDWRLRLSSLEASELTDEFLAVLADQPRVCPHLHLSLQSGSDKVLAAMQRRYRVAGFLRRVEQARRRLDQPAFTTDVIIGFPGETEADFAATLQCCAEVGFSKLHIFPFSPRRGTPAATLPGQLPAQLMAERRSRLAALESELAERYYRSLIGRWIQVLVERVGEGGTARGTACRYVPVRFSAQDSEEGALLELRVIEAARQHLVARRTPDELLGPASARYSLPVLGVIPASSLS